nr:hypothetical protein [Tanacetum cinerariifolium]
RPMRLKESASWDLDIGTWECWGECLEGFGRGVGVQGSVGKEGE